MKDGNCSPRHPQPAQAESQPSVFVTKGITMAPCSPTAPATQPRLSTLGTLGLAAALLTLGATGPSQATSLVMNGSFETLQTQASEQFGTGYASQTGTPYQTVANWSTSGYNFVFLPGTADTSGATGASGNLSLWGPGNGSANGLGPSPDGGNYIAADGAYQVAAITQTISGLSPGSTAVVSFYWAGAQQYGANYNSATTEQWIVGFGNDLTQATVVAKDAIHGFTGWMQQTFSFVVNSTTATLSFLAVGTPGGQPPFSLLDGVSVVQVPEPASWAVLLLGTGLAGWAARRRVPVARR